jgi:hypothetical protein
MKLCIAALALLLPCLAAAPDPIHGNDLGDPKAPILIEVFSDFQCPACKRFHDEELPSIVSDYVSRRARRTWFIDTSRCRSTLTGAKPPSSSAPARR